MNSLSFISKDLSLTQGTWEHRSLGVNRARWRQFMSHLPPQPHSQVGFLFLLSDINSLISFTIPLGSPAWRDKTPVALWMLWLYSPLLAMLQGAIAIS